MKKFGVPNTHSWIIVIDQMVDLVTSNEDLSNKFIQEFIKREIY